MWPGRESMQRENMLHMISAGRREVGDNSFLWDFKARMLSSRRAISRSMILRVLSNGLPVEDRVLILPGKKTIGFLI